MVVDPVPVALVQVSVPLGLVCHWYENGPVPPEMATVMDNEPPMHSVIFVGWEVIVISGVITTVTTLLIASPQPLPGVLMVTR